MAAENYERINVDLETTGMDLNAPVDLMPQGKFPILRNCRSYQDGRIEPRVGVVLEGS